MGSHTVFFLASLLTSLLASLPASALPREGASLLAFKAALLDSRGVLSDWNSSDTSPCNWTGVRCDARSMKVVSINLSGYNLSGTLVSDLGSLKKLHRLYLQYNNFYGDLPPQLGNCTRMRTLSLHHNNLSGGIPPQLGRFNLLQALYLQSNNFSGAIPLSFGNLKLLKTLDLSCNFLVGSIPYIVGNLSNLSYLNLSYNQLAGEIPTNGIFSKFGTGSFVGNLQLCGSVGFPACQTSPVQPYASVTWPLTPPANAQGASHKFSAIAITGICVGAFLFLKGLCILYLLRRWSKSSEHREINLGSGGKLVMFQGGASIASSKELLKCIGKLGHKDVIGEGGYGVVYKLVLKNSAFAIKKLNQCLESIRGFEAELETLGAIKHRNLAKLLGYCTSSTVKLLIYEYLPNGSLDDVLYRHTSGQEPLDWPTRHNIALGVARGLAYLHHDCDPRIIHRDVSASNVLLDADLQAHLADFGLARILGLYDTHVTTTVAGTFGYIAPEYAQGGNATDKVDVYSFGVLLLELLTGTRPVHPGEGEDINLAAWVRRLQEKGQEYDVIDKHLKATASREELQKVLFVACLCISKKPENRPSMKRVVEYLEGDNLSSTMQSYETVKK